MLSRMKTASFCVVALIAAAGATWLAQGTDGIMPVPMLGTSAAQAEAATAAEAAHAIQDLLVHRPGGPVMRR